MTSVCRRAARIRVAIVVLIGAPAVALADGQLWALRAAGLTGTAPAHGASQFQKLVSELQSNALWLIATGLGLAFTLVAAVMIAGSQRAPEHVFRMAGGIVLLLVIIPAVLA